MKLISDKRASKYKKFLRGICWNLDTFMRWFRKRFFCYYDIDMKNIQDQLKDEEIKLEKYHQVEQVAPQIKQSLSELERLKYENVELSEMNEHLKYLTTELYYADLAEDMNLKKSLYEKMILLEFIDVDNHRIEEFQM